MKRIEIPERFDCNVLDIMREGLDSHIKDDPNIIGSSSIAFCPKKIVISKLNNFKFVSNGKMLMGQIFENILYTPEVLSLLVEGQPAKLENDVFPRLALMGELSAFLFQGIWFDISEPDDYARAQERWQRERRY